MAEPMNSNLQAELINSVANTQVEVDKLRADAAATASHIVDNVTQNYVDHSYLKEFGNQLYSELLSKIENVKQTVNRTPGIRYDADNDVIMGTAVFKPVPDPGTFSGDPKETELFCQLCEDTFRYDNETPELVKINFVKSRLRGAARSWFLSHYPNVDESLNFKTILVKLSLAFTDSFGKKVSKIRLLELKQNYGQIKEYIVQFRKYSNELQISEENLDLLFYIGLHPKYKEELKKLDKIPDTLNSIISQCIIIEDKLNCNKLIKNNNNNNNNKNNHKKNFNNNSKNKNFHKFNNNNKFKNNSSNNNKNFNTNNDNNMINNVQKINSKN